MANLRPHLEQTVRDTGLWIRSNCHAMYTKLDEAVKSKKLDEKLQGLSSRLQGTGIDIQHLIYGLLAFMTIAWALTISVRRFRARNQVPRPSTPDPEKRSPFKAPPREPGGTTAPFYSPALFSN